MLKYFTNRYLAEKFEINLARWKRWSREFLPPDPLGGLQSGFARQYHPNQAFTVRLGGFLVSDLRFTIPESRQIIEDLWEWLKTNGYLFDPKGMPQAARGAGKNDHHVVFIQRDGPKRFTYTVRKYVSRDEIVRDGKTVFEECFSEYRLGDPKKEFAITRTTNATVLNLTRFLKEFTETLDLDTAHYPVLGQTEGYERMAQKRNNND